MLSRSFILLLQTGAQDETLHNTAITTITPLLDLLHLPLSAERNIFISLLSGCKINRENKNKIN